MNEKRYHVVKAKLNDEEYKLFRKYFEKSNAKNQAEFLRDRIFLSDRQISKRQQMIEKFGQEFLEGQMRILSELHSVINQYRAGIDEKLAVDKIEEGVRRLCQLQRS